MSQYEEYLKGLPDISDSLSGYWDTADITVIGQGLVARPIQDLADVETLRRLRNECRLFMTNDIKPITAEAQAAWFDMYKDYGPRRIEVWLIDVWREHGQPAQIGFLSLRYYHETTAAGAPHQTWDRGKADGGRNMAHITLGLTESERGRGYGTLIYRFARLIAGCMVEATIQATNTPSIRAARKAGYSLLAEMGETVILRADVLGERA
jgi:RimJ/RimL family protein N-acetyltransferase